ncbi:MAG: lysophospholipid acyltransferase family protein [Halieaceae bacterium]|nr:lysophospholipid acyltransferase family protein [Halieaceae bacterium]
MKAFLVRTLLRASALLPLDLSRACGRAVGRLLWWSRSSPRRITQRNIDLAFPELGPAERTALARRSLRATGELVCEMGFVWHRPWDELRRYIVDVRGDDAVVEAKHQGQGVVILGPHLGNWEVAGLYIATLGDALALYEPPHMTALEALVRSARGRTGARLAPTTARGLTTLVRTLRRGGVTCILPDQVPPVLEAGENSVFMGTPCFTMTFASKLLQRSGARAFFSFAERVDKGFRLHFVPADEALYSADIATSLAALNRGVEACLRVCPEQYQWEYKRFRTRPLQDDHYAHGRAAGDHP